MSSHHNTPESEGAVNLWMSVVEAAMCAVLVLATMIAAEQPQKAKEAGPDQEIVDVRPEVSDQAPKATSSTGRGLVRPTHKLVALETQGEQSAVIVIELDQPLPPEASVKFLISKQPTNPPPQ